MPETATKMFGRKAAVDKATFTIEKPAMIGNNGRSGAGKSTCLRMMNRLSDATAARIHLYDGDILSLTGGEKRAWQSGCALFLQ